MVWQDEDELVYEIDIFQCQRCQGSCATSPHLEGVWRRLASYIPGREMPKLCHVCMVEVYGNKSSSEVA